MNHNNIWAGLLGLILGIGLIIAFYGPYTAIVNLLDTEARPILAVIYGITMFLIGFMIPISLLTEDDRGMGA